MKRFAFLPLIGIATALCFTLGCEDGGGTTALKTDGTVEASCCEEGGACCEEGDACCATDSSCCEEGGACCEEGSSCCEGDSCAAENAAVLASVKAPPVSDVSRDSEIDAPTHRQKGMIKPKLDGKPIRLNTFCLDQDGTILAACGGKQSTYALDENGAYQTLELDEPSCLLRLSSTGEQLEKWDLEFQPSAVNVAPNGDIFVAGVGEIARISDGKIANTGTAPHMGDIEEFTAKAIEQAKKQAEQYASMFDTQIDTFKEQIANIEKIEEEERTRVQTAQLKAFQQQLEMYEQISEQQVAAVQPEAVVAQAKMITSIAVSDQDVFWVCQNIEGSGYTIWRTNHDFTEGTEVVSSVSGCCGQMDIQCCDGNLVMAENTSYKVGIYDRDGDKVNDFGARDRSSKKGFGSCCNPMNVRPLPDGTVLTAESSIGHIKRFDQDGKFLEYVGKAKVAGGCKHCAIGYDSNSDQYYMMHEDESAIVVLANSSTMPSQSEEEKVIAKLHNEFGPRFLGTWELKNDAAGAEEATADAALPNAASFLFESMTFYPDGKLEVAGGQYASMEADWTWEPQKGAKDQLTFSVLNDQVEMMPMTFKFVSENGASVAVNAMGMSEELSATRTKGCDGKPCGEQCEEEKKAKESSEKKQNDKTVASK